MLYNGNGKVFIKRRIGMENNEQMNFEQNQQTAENIPVNPYLYQPEDVQVQNAPPQGEPRFDPYTGKPLNVQPQKPEPRFDPYTGQPLNPQPQYTPPIYNAQAQFEQQPRTEELNVSGKRKAAIISLVFGAVSALLAYIAMEIMFFVATLDGPMVAAGILMSAFAIPGIVFGAIAKGKAKALLALKQPIPAKGCAVAGRITGMVGMIISIVFGSLGFIFLFAA